MENRNGSNRFYSDDNGEELYTDEASYEKTPKKKKKSKMLIILFILIGIILPAIVAGIAFVDHLFGKIQYQPKDEEITMVDVEIEPDTDDPDSVNAKDVDDYNFSQYGEPYMSDPNVKNILIIGRDTEESKSNSRSDVMMLLSICQTENGPSIKLSSFQRDIYAYIEGKGSDKLNHAHSYGGPQLCKKTLEGNFHVKIDNFISVNFTTFRKIIDIIGGIDLPLTNAEANYLHNDLTKLGYNKITAGTYQVNGATALNYCRIRYIDSDRERTQRHRNVINCIANQLSDINITQALSLLEECLPLVITDFDKSEMKSLAYDAVMQYRKWPRLELAVPANGTYTNATIRGMFVIVLDWDSNVKALQQFIYGKTYSESAS